MRIERSLSRAAQDRRAQLAAGGLAVAGAAAVAGKVAADHLGGEKKGRNRPSRGYRLKAKEGAPEGLRRIARGRAEKALDQLESAEGAELGAAIHGARKDLKKLRAVLRMIRDELAKDLFKAENRRYRDAGRLLSGTRDAEVKLETLEALRSRFEDDLPDDVSRWEEILQRERDEMVDAAVGETVDRVGEAVRVIARGRDRIGKWPFRTDSWKLVGPGLSTAYKQGRWAMERTLADPQAENVHEWRKRAKDLWYQLRIVAEAWPPLLGETADQAHELADLLGDHHDLAVLKEDLVSRQEVGEKKTFKTLIGRRQEELLASALEIGRRLYAEKPTAFSRRLKSYWSAWREA
jgi:CHAD domain-containing protein